ncbi:hypothetical protein AAG570_007171 [Ranatra chinensis]|uniref:Major facilitator superfamily (MFS) profile domain-containing protein n=1 Tax=Ranatra chinensis TaxID=642074 RepID=A0ABD0XX09_9HEMI
MFYIVAAVTTAVVVLTFVFFRESPPTPPSRAQAAVIDDTNVRDFKGSILRLLKNQGYVLLLISYGMNIGVYYALSTMLNQIILSYFVGAEEDAGRIGLTVVVAGMVGSALAGIVLDKTHWFKGLIWVVYFIGGLFG